MIRTGATILAGLACAWLLACGSKAPEQADAQSASETKASDGIRRDGKIRIEDAWQPIEPLIIHEAKMDLVVACRLACDEAKRAGHDMPLCYDETKRGKGYVRVIRVEHHPGTTANAMHALGMAAEGAHFLVERTGGRFQTLDLSYSARREGASRRDEIRIVACDGEKPRASEAEVAPLVRELQALYPAARVETVDAPTMPAPSPTNATPDATP